MICLISFTDRGEALARRLARALGGEAVRCGRGQSLDGWTRAGFARARGLVFVGAAGIAVRAVAPYVRKKTTDPAVVVVDEWGRFAVPILSGHLGGANDLARRIAALCGGVPVITTATDGSGCFAVDEWARRQGCRVVNPEKIKAVSAKLLAGGTVRVSSDWPIQGRPPAGVTPAEEAPWDVRLSLRREEGEALQLAPAILALGVGCRKDTPAEALRAAFRTLLDQAGVWEQAVSGVFTVDLKGEEPGLLAFCRERGLELRTFSPEQLAGAEGTFVSSPFVERTVGVDNVCQRSAVLGSGGALLGGRYAGHGVTMALAVGAFAPDWRWQDG